MVPVICFLIGLITLFSPTICAGNVFNANNNISANKIIASTTISQSFVDEFNTLTFNCHNHYLGLNNATNFALNNKELYYSTDTAIYKYDFTTKTVTLILEETNITSLSYVNNTLYAFKENALYKLTNNQLEKLYDCNMYSVYATNTTTYITYIYNNTFKAISVTQSDEVVLWDTSIPATYTPVAVANNESISYLVTKQNGSTKILEINFQLKTTTPFTYDFDIDNIYYWTNYNNVATLVYYTDGDLSTIVKQTDSNNYIDVYTKKLYNHGEHGFEFGKFYKIKYCYVYNNNLYVLDNVYSAIQKFEYTTDIKFVEVITSSSAYTDGKFYNPNSFNVVNKNNFVVADTNNKAIQVIENGNSKLVKSYNNNSNKVNFNYVLRVIKTNTNYYVLQRDELDNYQVLLLDINFNLVELVEHTLTTILDIELVNNDLYLIDYNTSTLYRYTNGLIESKAVNSLTLALDSKLHYIMETNKLTITSDNLVCFVDIGLQTTETYTNTNKVIGVSSDFKGNAYLLTDNKITRIDSSNILDTENQANVTLNKNYSYIDLEKETGNVYLFDSTNQCFEVLKSNKVYAFKTDYLHPLEMPNYINAEVVKIATAGSNVYCYNYPYNSGLSYNVSNKNIYILGEVAGYWYIAYKCETENNYSSLGLGYISKDSATIKNIDTLGISENYTVLTNTTIYALPTMLKYNNNNLVIGTLNKDVTIKTKHELISGLEFSIDGCDYLAITTEQGIGYVKKVDVVSNKANKTEEILKTNAKLVVSEDNYNAVYVYAGSDSFVIDKLLVDKEIYVDNYDINSKYTYIKYLDNNNREHGGYVLTKCIKMNNNGTTNVGAIILIVLTVIALGGITIFYIISYKKQQKNLDNTPKN